MALTRFGRLGLALLCLSAGISGTAAQENVTKLGTFSNWSAWTATDANGEICYISADPQQMQPTNVDHGEVHFFVIHRKGLGTKNEVQARMGYNLQEGTFPEASVDGKTTPMVFQGQAAWLTNRPEEQIENVEAGFVSEMKAGREMTIKATSQRGTNTSYTYSLSGVTAAMNEIDKACA